MARYFKLKKNKNIIIKEAGRHGAVVIMNTKHYHKIVESNCDAKVMKRTAKVLEKIKYN